MTIGPHSIYNQVYFSDRIIVGTVKELRPNSDFIDVFIRVDEWLKNPLPKEEITVRIWQPNIAPPNATNFSIGKKALLMLKDAEVEKGIFILLYGDLGKHPVSDKDEVIVVIDKLLSPATTTPQIKPETSSFEKKAMVVGGTWGKGGWNLSVRAVDKKGSPGFILISVSYQGKQLGDARIETGKSYTYKGKNPDGSEVPLLTIKEGSIFVGASTDAVLLEINWSTPGSNVQILGVPEESGQTGTTTPVPTPTVPVSPEAPGFEIAFGILGILAVWRRLKR